MGADRNTGANFNRYWYANNNPYTNIDPDGRNCVSNDDKTTCDFNVTGSRIPQSISFPTPGNGSGGAGGGSGSGCPECDEVRATRAGIMRDGAEAVNEAAIFGAKEGAKFAAGGFLGKIIGRLGVLFRIGAKSGERIDPNKLRHIFGQPRHNLGPLMQRFGSQEAAYNAVNSAAQATVTRQGITGVFETTVSVGGQSVVVRGNVVDEIVRIGTFFIP